MLPILSKSIEISRALYPQDFGERRCWHVSLLFERSRLLLVAENSSKTHARNIHNNSKTKFDLGKKATCSELLLFLRAKNKFSNLKWNKWTVVNVRIDREGEIRMSKPCITCDSLLAYVRPKKLYYTNNRGEFEEYE